MLFSFSFIPIFFHYSLKTLDLQNQTLVPRRLRTNPRTVFLESIRLNPNFELGLWFVGSGSAGRIYGFDGSIVQVVYHPGIFPDLLDRCIFINA